MYLSVKLMVHVDVFKIIVYGTSWRGLESRGGLRVSGFVNEMICDGDFEMTSCSKSSRFDIQYSGW